MSEIVCDVGALNIRAFLTGLFDAFGVAYVTVHNEERQGVACMQMPFRV